MLGAASSASSASVASASRASVATGGAYSGARGGAGRRSYSGHSSTSARTGSSPSSSPSRYTRMSGLAVTVPMTAPPRSHFSQHSSTASTFAGASTQSMRSCDSETMISNGSMSASRSGTAAISRSMPTPPLLAISDVEEVSPAAPRSCSESNSSRSSSSSEHSSSFFSSNGSPTWTVGRLPPSPSSPPSSADASTDAPPMPSRPVEAPNSTSTLPAPAAALRTSRSRGASPSAIALMRQLCS